MRILEKINFLILLVISISFQAEAQFIKNLEQEVEKMIIRNQLKSS
jgi:hypothetical protein